MADTTFVANQTHIVSTWLNDVNKAVYRAIGTGVGGVAPVTPADVRTNLKLSSVLTGEGASLIGNDPSGGSLGANVQAALDLKANITSLDTITHQTNPWDATLTPGDAEQHLVYTTPATTTVGGRDRGGWVALIHNQGTCADNLTPLIGHSYHDATFDNLTGGAWGVVTEAWSNATNFTTLIGGEFATISQCPTAAAPSVGVNAVFKNRLDGAASPVGGGTLFNYSSAALFVTSQARPLSGNTSAGSGWQTALKVGDVGFGSGLDWEGGQTYPGSTVYKAYTSIVDMTNALTDLAGGYPWFALYRNQQTYWGMRFNGVLSGSLDSNNCIVNAGGAGYAAGDIFNITSGGGTGGIGVVLTAPAGAVTAVLIAPLGRGSGYQTTVGATTAKITGAGNNALTLNLAPANGYAFGGDLGIAAGGAGYAINDIVSVNGATAGAAPIYVKVTNVAAGAVTEMLMVTPEATPAAGRPSQGAGYTTGNKATTNVSSAGAGFQVAINKVYVDVTFGGEKWEFWRMANPSNPTASGSRDSYIDASFPAISRSVGLALNDSYSTALIQAITSSTSPTVSTIGSAATHHWAMASTDAAWNAAAVGAYAGKIAIAVDGVTKYIPTYA